MLNNDVLRKVRYILDLDDHGMISICRQGDLKVNREQISQWLKRDDDPDYMTIKNVEFARFLNGLINEKRGKKEGEQPEPEKKLNNNIVFRKLTIAFNLKSEDVVEVLALADLRVSKHELSAFFRKPGTKNYRDCKDQVLRNFLIGLQTKFRGDSE